MSRGGRAVDGERKRVAGDIGWRVDPFVARVADEHLADVAAEREDGLGHGVGARLPELFQDSVHETQRGRGVVEFDTGHVSGGVNGTLRQLGGVLWIRWCR
ncbi:hypothetical protein ABQE62_05835 [Mycolicibacterium fortuitum]